jgi:secondary thiamine-phosphate synthase enzyme
MKMQIRTCPKATLPASAVSSFLCFPHTHSLCADMEDALNRLAPENANYRHDAEGSDDMPAHIKSALFGVSLNIPITNGRLALGLHSGLLSSHLFTWLELFHAL